MKRRTIPNGRHAQQRRRSRTLSKSLEASSGIKISNKRSAEKTSSSSILGLSKVETISKGEKKISSEKDFGADDIAECHQLREQLERVLRDHQRQEDEIVALRALAKSLKEEVETIQARHPFQRSISSSDEIAHADFRVSHLESHELFKLDVQVEELQGENTELRHQLEIAQEDLKSARACIAQKLPTYKLAAIKANAELRCVKSQLQQERVHSDSLHRQLVRCKARQDDVAVRVSPERGNNQEDCENDLKESEAIRRERAIFLQQCMHLPDDETFKKSTRETSGREDNASANENQEDLTFPILEPRR